MNLLNVFWATVILGVALVIGMVVYYRVTFPETSSLTMALFVVGWSVCGLAAWWLWNKLR